MSKKSINAKDITSCNLINKATYLEQNQQYIKTQHMGFLFLSKISGNKGNRKYLKQNKISRESYIKLNEQTGGNISKMQILAQQEGKQNRVDNFSPFTFQQQLNDTKQYKNCLRERKQRNKTCVVRLKTLLHQRKCNYNTKAEACGHKQRDEMKQYAKITQLHAQFHRVRLLDKQLDFSATTNLNAYQMSQKLKNLGLIKTKLVSLGCEADEDQRDRCKAIQKLMQSNKRKKFNHSYASPKKQTVEGLDQMRKADALLKIKSMHERNQNLPRRYRNPSQIQSVEQLELASKTIQIKCFERRSMREQIQFSTAKSRQKNKQKKLSLNFCEA